MRSWPARRCHAQPSAALRSSMHAQPQARPVAMHDEIEASAARVAAWVERNGYRAYDPGDGQMSFLRGLTFDSMLLERILTASVLRTPFNIRPLLGIRPHTSTKGMGYMAWGYLWRYRLTRKQEDADKAFACLDWLTQHRAPGYKDFC